MKKDCKQCGKTYIKRSKQAYWQFEKGLYCSKSCKGKAQGFQRVIQPTKTCNVCSIAYSKPSNQPLSWWALSNYCSQKCFRSKTVTAETREKHRIAMLGNKHGLGHSPSLEHREKLSKVHIARWDLIGRASKVNPRANRIYRNWRQIILERDNFTCQQCNARGQSARLEIHHIKEFKNFPELRFESTNVVTLCRECHKKTDNYGAKLNNIYGSAS